MRSDNFKLTNHFRSARMIANDIANSLAPSQIAEILMNMQPVLSWSSEEILRELEIRDLLDIAIDFEYVVKNHNKRN